MGVNPFEGMEPEAMLRMLREKAGQLEADAGRIRAELTAASATASSPDGAVTVTLAPNGALQDISFSAKASSHQPEALGPLVMRTVAAAQRRVAERVAGSVTDPAAAEYLRGLTPHDEPARARPERDPDDEYGGVLRKRAGGRS
jgi:DNA-binding protein YbaB